MAGNSRDAEVSLRVVIADDHPIFKQALTGIVQQLEQGVKIHEAADYGELMNVIDSEEKLDLIVADLKMPGGDSWNALITVCQRAGDVPVLVLTGSDDPITPRKVAAAGASGYAVKSQSPDSLLSIFRDVLAGERCFPAHMEASLSHMPSLDDQAEMESWALSIVNSMSWGVMRVDMDGRVEYRNTVASTILESRDAIFIDGRGILRAHNRDHGKMLLDMIGNAARGERLEDEFLKLERASGAAAYAVAVAPMAPGTGVGARVYVRDPEMATMVPLSLLINFYELTDTEARVTQALMSGRRVEDITEDFGVSVNTVRTHLKKIFNKTGVSSQADLIRLILGDAGNLSPDRE